VWNVEKPPWKVQSRETIGLGKTEKKQGEKKGREKEKEKIRVWVEFSFLDSPRSAHMKSNQI